MDPEKNSFRYGSRKSISSNNGLNHDVESPLRCGKFKDSKQFRSRSACEDSVS